MCLCLLLDLIHQESMHVRSRTFHFWYALDNCHVRRNRSLLPTIYSAIMECSIAQLLLLRSSSMENSSRINWNHLSYRDIIVSGDLILLFNTRPWVFILGWGSQVLMDHSAAYDAVLRISYLKGDICNYECFVSDAIAWLFKLVGRPSVCPYEDQDDFRSTRFIPVIGR